jgi:DNA-binding transcriptional ArsR family regulator
VSHDLPQPPVDAISLDGALSALAHPMRRRVVLELAAGDGEPRSCASFALPKARSTRSHHWKVLREAGLISQRDFGNGSVVTLRRRELEARFPGLLDALRLAEAPERS